MINVLQSTLQAAGSIVTLKVKDIVHAEIVQQALIDLVVYCIDTQLGEINDVDDTLIHAGIIALLMRDFKTDAQFAMAAENTFSLGVRVTGKYKHIFYELVNESDELKRLTFDSVNKIYQSWVDHGSAIP